MWRVPVPLSVLAFAPAVADVATGAEAGAGRYLTDAGENWGCSGLPDVLAVGGSIQAGQHRGLLEREGPQTPPRPVCSLHRRAQRDEETCLKPHGCWTFRLKRKCLKRSGLVPEPCWGLWKRALLSPLRMHQRSLGGYGTRCSACRSCTGSGDRGGEALGLWKRLWCL